MMRGAAFLAYRAMVPARASAQYKRSTEPDRSLLLLNATFGHVTGGRAAVNPPPPTRSFAPQESAGLKCVKRP
ncbi:unnamed protein product [Leptosia nina]|uniref:Secreted protein n=1 Tax=Leptosia nina TaxID=320188 RepID=A0AAV1IY69_9NEOP